MPHPAGPRKQPARKLLDLLNNEFEILMQECIELRSQLDGHTKSTGMICTDAPLQKLLSPSPSASALPNVAQTSADLLPVSNDVVAGDENISAAASLCDEKQCKATSICGEENRDQTNSPQLLTSPSKSSEDKHHPFTVSVRVEKNMAQILKLDEGGKRKSTSRSLLSLRDKLVQNSIIDCITSLVILFNMAFLGISYQPVVSTELFFVVEVCFAGFFIAERLLKLWLSGFREFFVGPEKKWNVFETVLVGFTILDLLWNSKSVGRLATPILRILRISRIAKIIRVLRINFFSELLEMANGVLGGGRTLFWSFILISVPLYVLSLVMVEIAAHDAGYAVGQDVSDSFATVPSAFFNLFRCTVVGDCSDAGGRPIFVLLLTSHGWGFAVVYFIMIMTTQIGLLNVIVSIFVERATSAAKHNESVIKRKRIQDDAFFVAKSRELVSMVLAKMATTNSVIHQDGILSVPISAEFFTELCKDSHFRDILCELDIAEDDQSDLFETLDVDAGGTLDTEELLLGISRLRGDPRRADVISVSLGLRSLQCSFSTFASDVREFMKRSEGIHQ